MDMHRRLINGLCLVLLIFAKLLNTQRIQCPTPCEIGQTCAMVRHGQGPPSPGCISMQEAILLNQALNGGPSGPGTGVSPQQQQTGFQQPNQFQPPGQFQQPPGQFQQPPGQFQQPNMFNQGPPFGQQTLRRGDPIPGMDFLGGSAQPPLNTFEERFGQGLGVQTQPFQQPSGFQGGFGMPGTGAFPGQQFGQNFNPQGPMPPFAGQTAGGGIGPFPGGMGGPGFGEGPSNGGDHSADTHANNGRGTNMADNFPNPQFVDQTNTMQHDQSSGGRPGNFFRGQGEPFTAIRSHALPKGPVEIPQASERIVPLPETNNNVADISQTSTETHRQVSQLMEDAEGLYYLFYSRSGGAGIRVNFTKSGFCRRDPSPRDTNFCMNICFSDEACPLDMKCCPRGCSLGCLSPGHVQDNHSAQNENPARSPETANAIEARCSPCNSHLDCNSQDQFCTMSRFCGQRMVCSQIMR